MPLFFFNACKAKNRQRQCIHMILGEGFNATWRNFGEAIGEKLGVSRVIIGGKKDDAYT